MGILEWCSTKTAAWAFFFVGVGGGGLLNYFLPPEIGIPISLGIITFGIYLLIRAYRHRDKRLDEPRKKCKRGDHSWFNDASLKGIAYTYEPFYEVDSYGRGLINKGGLKTCLICKKYKENIFEI